MQIWEHGINMKIMSLPSQSLPTTDASISYRLDVLSLYLHLYDIKKKVLHFHAAGCAEFVFQWQQR